MRPEKTSIVSELTEKMKKSAFVLVADYQRMNVGHFGELRNRLVPVGAEMHVVKNSFLKRAMADSGFPDVGEKLTGQTAVVNFAVFPQSNPYLGPVVILADGGSASTSEIFAGGLQELGRAVVVGERTAGAALPSYFQRLPTGALFQYAIADFTTPKGVLIEGRGVAPDVEVKMNRRALLDGHDPQLDAAIEEIMKRAQGQQLRKAAFR